MAKEACALVMIHGLAKKPPNPGIAVERKCVTSASYWADVFYGTDYDTDLASYNESAEGMSRAEGVTAANAEVALPVPENEREARFLQQYVAKLSAQPGPPIAAAGTPAGAGSGYERVPLPAVVKEAIIKRSAVEAYYFLFNKRFRRKDGEVFDTRSVLRNRLIQDLLKAREAAERVVLMSHSMGTMIAYDVLRNCAQCPPVDGFITLGSPLGVDDVQDGLIPEGENKVDYPAQRLTGPWVNVYDTLDVVCAADPILANDFLRAGTPVIRDINEQNWGSWRHSIAHYLKGPKLRAALRELAGI